jgi:hypothetical protein
MHYIRFLGRTASPIQVNDFDRLLPLLNLIFSEKRALVRAR